MKRSDLIDQIKKWAVELGFQQVGISSIDLGLTGQRLQDWLNADYHGEMEFMAKHGPKRYQPEQLVPGTLSIIAVRMDYLPPQVNKPNRKNQADIAFYALGRDYHKLIRKRLQKLAEQIDQYAPHHYRVFTDSAPVMEKPIAVQAGLGWMGKHSNLINRRAGSWFFLGEIYTSLDLPADQPVQSHCGRCQACIDRCPTQAIIAPYQVDARLCISYLTIEHKSSIPLELRPLIGNHIYGCDDCLLICPWNRFARPTQEKDFWPRPGLDSDLIELFKWTEKEFLNRTAGSPIRRIGYMRWLRNLAVAIGNSGQKDEQTQQALKSQLGYHPISDEHILWALAVLNKDQIE